MVEQVSHSVILGFMVIINIQNNFMFILYFILTLFIPDRELNTSSMYYII